jgi:hypothetical protein
MNHLGRTPTTAMVPVNVLQKFVVMTVVAGSWLQGQFVGIETLGPTCTIRRQSQLTKDFVGDDVFQVA